MAYINMNSRIANDDDIKVCGFRVYKHRDGLWGVQSIDNYKREIKKVQGIGGDYLFFSLEEAEAEAKLAYKRMIYQEQRALKMADEAEALLLEKEMLREKFEGFIRYKKYSPAVAARAIKALLSSWGTYVTKEKLVTDCLKRGYVIGEWQGQRTFKSVDEVFWTERQLGKVALDYAEYLINGGTSDLV
jgi:hypothetical protein